MSRLMVKVFVCWVACAVSASAQARGVTLNWVSDTRAWFERPRQGGGVERVGVDAEKGTLKVIDARDPDYADPPKPPENRHGGGGDPLMAPNGRFRIHLHHVPGDSRKVTLINSVPKEGFQPSVRQIDYLKPGDAVPYDLPVLVDTASKRRQAIDSALFANPWWLDRWSWKKDSSAFRFVYNQRGHQVMRVIEVSTNGVARALVDERCPTFFCYSSKFFLKFLDATDELLWMSERSGWNHLYLYDTRTGEVKNAVTSGEWVVKSVESVDEAARTVYFKAVGVVQGQDPYYEHYCRVSFDGSGFRVLTEGDGTHKVKPSPDGRYFVDTWSRVDLPPVSELRRRDDGTLICELGRDPGAAGWRPPERFHAPGRDGVTGIYGLIWRPNDFDPALRYPVVEDIYAGPHDAHVPKAYITGSRCVDLANRGFIVVQIDGMGTNWRSKRFHDVAWKNIADAGLPDRIAWLRAAAERYPQMDLSRVGIYGGSAGGQSAMGALLWHGDFYKAAVADCGCHDNCMDKIWWNEQWMGWPVGPHYREQSNITQAHRLRGELLLMVGEVDDNVDPSSTYKVVDALIKADKDFELLVIPGGGHCAGSVGKYGWRRLKDFFVRKLGKPVRREAGADTGR